MPHPVFTESVGLDDGLSNREKGNITAETHGRPF